MSGNPISIQHQRHAPLLSEGTLQGPGTHRTSRRQTQALQTYRAAMREDGAELRLLRRACSRLHLDQIRPHGLVVRVRDCDDGNARDQPVVMPSFMAMSSAVLKPMPRMSRAKRYGFSVMTWMASAP